MNDQKISLSLPKAGAEIYWGWRPRASFKTLMGQAMHETISRPIFLCLILISLIIGVCQVSVFTSVILGVQDYINEAMTSGSRLNRVVIKPKRNDLKEEVRFPVFQRIDDMPEVLGVVPRRVTIASLQNFAGRESTYTAMGLHDDDPEYKLLQFVSGGPFSPGSDQLEVIVTASLLNDLFDPALSESNNGDSYYQQFIGKKVAIGLSQYTATGKVKNKVTANLTIRGVILKAEGSRQLYLPNVTHLAFDRFKRDRTDSYALPFNEDRSGWNDLNTVREMADFPWEDSLHIYARDMESVVLLISNIAKLGYRPKSEIWDFKWALDLKETAWTIFLPLLVLIVLSVMVTVSANIFTSAKLRESELALWRVLGMRRGDLVLTQVMSTLFSVGIGAMLGLAGAHLLLESGKDVLAKRSAEAALNGVSDVIQYDVIFSDISEFSTPLLLTAIVLGVIFSIYPAIRSAGTDPAKVFK